MGETDQHRDPLEAELAAFRPQPMSPGLQSQIDATLAEPPPAWRIGAALLTFAAAACVVIIGLTWSHTPKPGTNYVNTGTRPSTPFHGNTLNTASPPSVVDYQRAFAESSDAFNALLDRPAGSETAPVRAFSRSSVDSVTTNGD